MQSIQYHLVNLSHIELIVLCTQDEEKRISAVMARKEEDRRRELQKISLMKVYDSLSFEYILNWYSYYRIMIYCQIFLCHSCLLIVLERTTPIFKVNALFVAIGRRRQDS